MCTDKAMVRVCLTVGVVVVAGLGSGAPASAAADNGPLSGHAASLYRQAKETGRFFDQAQRLHPEVRPTSDGQSFSLIWKSAPSPRRWIVSLHGAGHPAKGFATDDLAIWHRHLAGREVGLVSLQWWMGTGSEAKDFYTPLDMYREIDLVLQHAAREADVPVDVLRVRDVLEGLREEFGLRVARDLAELAVHAHPAPFGGDHRDPDGRVVERGEEKRLAFAAPVLRDRHPAPDVLDFLHVREAFGRGNRAPAIIREPA